MTDALRFDLEPYNFLRVEGHLGKPYQTVLQRLLRLMGLEAIYPKPRLSQGGSEHRIYPYLLRNVAIVRPNQVWSSDITYVPMPPSDGNKLA